MKKRVLSVLLAIVMVVGLFPVTAGATTAEPVKTWNIGAPESGNTATDAVVAKLYTHTTDNTKYDLVISGTGEMDSTHGTSMPWKGSGYQEHIVSVTVQSGVTNVEQYAFMDCTALTSVTLADTVTEIGGYAFDGCTSLTGVTIPASTTSIASSAFGGCTSLTAYTVDSGNTKYSATDGILFSKDGTTLVSYPSNKSGNSYTVPDSVTKISTNAFCYMKNLTELTIPHTTTSIVGTIFYGKVVEGKITIKGHTGSAAEAYTKEDTDSTTFVSICSDGDDADTLCDVCGYDTAHTHPVCGATCTHEVEHNTLDSWTKLTASDLSNGTLSLTDGKSYYLGEDITVSASVEISGTVNLCLNGHVLSLDESAEDCVIVVDANSTLNLCDCNGTSQSHKFTVDSGAGLWTLDEMNGTETVSGGVITGGKYSGIYVGTGELNQYGGHIVGNQYEDGGGVYLYGEQSSESDKYRMFGGSVIGNTATECGGGIYIDKFAEFELHGGTVSSNRAGEQGGGIYTEQGGGNYTKFTMTDGTVSDNTAVDGGGIYSSCDITMSGGSITGNSASATSGGVYARGTMAMSGGSITGNTAGTSGGGLWLYDSTDSYLIPSGKVIINNNTLTNGANNNVYTDTSFDTPVQISGTLEAGSSIGISFVRDHTNYPFAEPDGDTVTSLATGYKNYFFSDDSAYVVVVDGNNLKLAEPPAAETHSHDMSVACGGSTVTYTAWDGTGNFPGGDVYLTDDVTLTDTLTISSGTVNLCLNGNSITKESGTAIQVNTGATLNICDCKGSGSIMATGDSGRGIYLNSSTGTVNVYGGTVQATGDSGNGIYINNGTGTVSGGTVKATGTNGKGIYINSAGEVAVSGGTIEATGNNGRGIDNSSGANATVTGGNVTATGSESYGVYNGYAGSFKLSGAPAISGTAADVYIDGEKIVTITGALTYIEENDISVEMNTPGTFTSGWTTKMGSAADNYGSYFTSADSGYIVQKNGGGELELAAPTSYTVTYNGNGATSGDVPADSNSPYISGSTVTVLGNTGNLAKTGYAFVGWNTWSSGYGTDYAPGATFNINSNTTLYAQWEEYEITTQPTESTPAVGTNADGDIASYQWYKGTMSEVTDTADGVSAYTEDTLTSSYSGGWWTCHEAGGYSTPGYFTIVLNAGDSILAQTSSPINEGQLGIWAAYEKQDWDWTTPDDHFLVTAPADGNYDLHVSDVTYGGGTQPTVKAQVFHIGSTPADGATSKTLVANEDGWYACKITYKDGTVLYSGPVEYEAPSIPVTGVELSESSLTLDVNGTAELTATISPNNATDKTVSWTSSDPTVAKVENGLVTALKPGSTTITATANDGSGKSATCSVTVNKIAITGPIAITTTQEPTVGQEFSMDYIVIPIGNYSRTSRGFSPDLSIEAGKDYTLSVGLKPNDGYYFADGVAATVNGKNATIYRNGDNISINYTYSFAAPKADSVDILLSGISADTAPVVLPGVEQNDVVLSFTAKVLDQYGQEMTGQTIEWSITGTNTTGISVNNGTVTVTKDAAVGNYTLTATCDGKSDSITIKVEKAESVATSIKIFKGENEVTADTIYIPEQYRNTVNYTAVVYDQYGEVMSADDAEITKTHENTTATGFGSTEVNNRSWNVYVDASTGNAGSFDLVLTSGNASASVHITFAYLETQTITCANVTGTYGQTEELKLNPSGKQTADAYRFAIKSGASTDVVEVASDGKLTIKNAGETTIVVTAPSDATHASASVEVKVTIYKADITECTAPTANDLTHSGSAQALITEGSATGGNMMYAIGTAEQVTGEWSTDTPTGTDIGSYYVWYKIVGDRNHNNKNFETPITVTIAPNTYIVTYLPGINGTGTQTTDTKTQGVVLTLRGAIFTRTGYTQTGWATTDSGEQVYALGASYTADAPITLYPVWTANTNTAYTVEHWQQNVERNDYVKVDTDEKTGTTGAATVAAAKTYTGFTAQSFNQVAIAADGGTVVKIYYNRNTYTVTYTDNGVFLSNVTFEDVVYGAKAPTYHGTTTRPGYTFGGWYKDSGLTTIWNFENDTINGPTTIYAKWTEKNAVSITETAQTYTWDGNPKSFAITGTPNNEFTVQYKINDNWTTTAPSAVGTYDVKITRAEDDTYKAYEKIITGGLVINAAAPEATAPTAKTGLVYDGNAKSLINAGTSEHGYWEYSLDGTSYSSDISTGTDAKTYTVYCRFVPNTGYSEVNPVQLSVTIAPLAIDEPAVVGTYTYTGSEQTVTLDGVLDCMTVRGNKGTDAGCYEVSITLDGNHKWNAESDGKIAWSIVAKTVTPTAALEYASIIYSGSERKPAVTLTDGDIEISVGEYTVVYSNNVNVGTAIVTITDKENGNYTFAEITKTFEIMKDGVSPVLSMDDYVYGGTPAVPNVSGNAGSGTVTVYYSTDSSRVDKLWEDISGTTLNVGTYYMKAHVAATDNYAEGISPVVTFKVTPGKYVAPSAPTASEFTVTVNEADRGKILEYSLDGTNWISVPVLTNGAFELKGLSESTQYTVYLRVKASADGNYQASDAVSTVWTTPARYSVAYHANLGTGNVPASVTQNSGRSVTVARGSGLKRTGYTFAGWNTAADGTGTDYAPGSAISTGATLYAKWTANSYTVKFKANGGSGTMDDQSFTYDATQALTGNAFTRDGYHFAGWSLSSGNTAIYMDGQTVKNLSDKGTVTLHAVWAEDVYNIGADFSSDSNHQIIAKLMRGDAQIGSTQSVTMSGNGAPYTGHFDFTGVPKGVYNIVAAQDGKVMTKLIIITDHDDTVEITMPASEVNSVLEVSEDALPVVVGGLEDEAVTKAEESKTVTITMTVEKQEEQQLPDNASESEKATQEAIAEIKEEASGKTFEFMDIEVEKTVEEAGQADVSEKLTETNKVMEIVIPFDLTGKMDIAVYRHHNGQTEQFTENTTKADGTFYIDAVNHLIHVFSRKFSTYAIGYTEPASPAPDYPPVVSVHSCTSKCDVCGGCEDAACTESACKDKCRLLGMNFTDVAEGKWYTEPVEYVYHHKMMEGVGNNLFDINGTTTRAMIVTILWRLEGEPVVNYLMQFEDIPADTWYTEAVRWAASEKIVEGYSDTAFGPTDPITREQFATILWRYAKYKGYDVSVGEDTNILSYEDAFSISEYAIPAMQWACGAGLMQGDGVNLTPKADATRAQAAALFQRFCENVAEK